MDVLWTGLWLYGLLHVSSQHCPQAGLHGSPYTLQPLFAQNAVALTQETVQVQPLQCLHLHHHVN